MGKLSRKLVFVIGLIWQGVSLMLPPQLGIPLVLIGLVLLIWALRPLQTERFLRQLPAPVSRPFYWTIQKIKLLFDEAIVNFPESEQQKDHPTFVKFAPNDPGIFESNNILSVTNDRVNERYDIDFRQPLNETTLAVHPIGEMPRNFTVEVATNDFVRIKFKGKEPEVIALRFDD